MNPPDMREDAISQIPALQLLCNLGYTYLNPEEALEARGGRRSGVLLDSILERQLRKINKIRFKGEEYEFSEGNIQSGIQGLKEIPFDGLVRTNEKIYDLLCLGKSLQQSIYGDIKSFPFQYIDWKNIKNNAFHVTMEYVVERTGSHETRRPDIVLFVNGIPLVVIECKSPAHKEPVEEAVSQQIRNQRLEEIPKLFQYSQILLALAVNDAKYATVGTPAKFWAIWREKEITDKEIRDLVNHSLPGDVKDKIFRGDFAKTRSRFEVTGSSDREVTEQDRILCTLTRHDRLLEFMFRYILFDAGEKKIARYQQYFCVRKILDRVRNQGADSRRKGGVVWHTQGSGKSLTMVMLANGLAMEPDLDDFKIVLVTDRVDLDDQIYKTFRHCGTNPEQAKTGKHLSDLLQSHKQRIITTIIDKFEAAVGKNAVTVANPNIFVLVDESHRGQYGPIHAKMRKALHNACFIGFTGTPVLKKERNTVERFGGLIDSYPIDQAVLDKAVVPLLYEGRHVDQKVDEEAIDTWFENLTGDLSPEQIADLKKKFSTSNQLNKTEQKVMRIAWDISTHFRDNWQGTPYKGQLVAQDKATALIYKKFLDEFGMVTSEVLISGPDDREGNEDIYEGNKQEVVAFWNRMVGKNGRFVSEKEYNRQIINSFKYNEEPEIVIVVDKLLTGFDAPRNTILYLTRKLEEHSLLQAIARVNRLYEGKEFGYIIDYRGVLQNLDHAFDLYGQLSEYEPNDLGNALTDVSVEASKLPQRHSDVWDLFKGIKNKQDVEAYEQLLADEATRNAFYERLSLFSRTLSIALASVRFHEDTPEQKIEKYWGDLKFFMQLRTSVRRRYAEVVDFKEYEAKIQKLLDKYVGTGEVQKVTGLVNIFDAEAFSHEVEKLESIASKADTIAYRTKRTITERMQEDPAFYRKFSAMLEDTIRAFLEKRLSDASYLKKVTEIRDSIRNRTGDDIPHALRSSHVAKAFYGSVLDILEKYGDGNFDSKKVSVEAGIEIDRIIRDNRIVNWENNTDVQNQMRTQIEDMLFVVRDRYSFDLTFEDIDRILEQCLEIGRVRYSS